MSMDTTETVQTIVIFKQSNEKLLCNAMQLIEITL